MTRDNLTTEEKRRLMTADRLLSLNGMDKEQLRELCRSLAQVVMTLSPDSTVETDWEFLYQDLWDAGINEFHEDRYDA